MRTKLLLLAVVTLVTLGASVPGSSPAILCTIDEAQYVVNINQDAGAVIARIGRTVADGYCTEVTAAGVTDAQTSTADEIELWTNASADQIQSDAGDNLKADIEPGKKWVTWLRQYAQEQRDAAAVWDGYTTSQKLVVMKTKLQKDAKVMDGLADLLLLLRATD